MNDVALTAYQIALNCMRLDKHSRIISAFEDANNVGHPAAGIRLHWLHAGASGVISANNEELKKYQSVSITSINALEAKASSRGENDSESQFVLGWCYQQGLGVNKNFAKAAKYYWVAANQAHRDAQYQLGVCCSSGIGVRQNMLHAIAYYEQAAAQGHIHANYILFQCYEWGLGVRPDPVKAANFKLAAQKGQHPWLASSGLSLTQYPVNNRENKEVVAQLEQAGKEKEAQLKQKKLELYQQSYILIGEKELRCQQQSITAKQYWQLHIEGQQLNKQHRQEEKMTYLIKTLREKESELKAEKAKLELHAVELEKALQKRLEREYMLELQVQKYQEKRKSEQPRASNITASFFKGSKSPKFKPAQNEETLLLKYVVEGHLEKTENLLKSDPNLVLIEENVQDLSEREFKKITALQYAYWALDREMMMLVIKYMGKNDALTQLQIFESNPSKYSAYGLHYNNILIEKMKEYLNNYQKWNAGQREKYWQREVGGAQRLCPAWLVYAMCEEGKNAAWTQNDEKRTVVRQYDKRHLKWWFEKEYNGGKLGDKWGVCRGLANERGTHACIFFCVHHDKEIHEKYERYNLQFVNNLKTSLMECSPNSINSK